jgi:hypothetical protein
MPHPSRPVVLAALLALALGVTASAETRREHVLLATSKTSTMQKEMKEAAERGYRFDAVMGGETAWGGSEAVVVMSREAGQAKAEYDYVLLATNKTSTMQKEISEAARNGFVYRSQTVFSSLFGGKEVVVIMERARTATAAVFEYKLLATSKTSTMQKEMGEAEQMGYEVCGMTVGETAFGGKELVVFMRRPAGK